MLRLRLLTMTRLGIQNVVNVGLYRSALRLGMITRLLPEGEAYQTPIFGISESAIRKNVQKQSILNEANALLNGGLRYFSCHDHVVGSPPDWFSNPFVKTLASSLKQHWTHIPDFDAACSDIKCLWEASRFDWTIRLAQAYCLTGEQRYLATLNAWTSDWTTRNPLNIGPNWKCGQEAAIRMMHVLLAACLLKNLTAPKPGLRRFVTEHCARIAPTIRYAMAQNNNHGTSEATGLYIGGSWLNMCCQDNRKIRRKAAHWQAIGARWLENRVRALIAPDGSFSQYSLNYHRVVVDTLNMAEFWRRELCLPKFSEQFYQRAAAAVNWLYQMVDPETGDGPNVGANDGACVFPLSCADYRDYRPSVQLGAALFLGIRLYAEHGTWDELCEWLRIARPSEHSILPERNYSASDTLNPVRVPNPDRVQGGFTCQNDCDRGLTRHSQIMPHGGYVLLHFPTSWGMIRFPNFRFRPSHADALHLDLWTHGRNILRDAGTYSYHTDAQWQNYFPGTQAHNTVEFDGRDQMPRISRFLFGAWLNMETMSDLHDENGWLTWTGSYVDDQGCRHQRTVSSNGMHWKIVDDISGFRIQAILRWRLLPGAWSVHGLTCCGERADIRIHSSGMIARCELVEGWESRYYMAKTPLPVLEVEVPPAHARLTTDITLNTP